MGAAPRPDPLTAPHRRGDHHAPPDSYLLRTTDPDLIHFLTSPHSGLTLRLGGHRVTAPTDGGVLVTDVEVLRGLAEHEDGSITDGSDGPVLWVEGDPHPLTPA